MVIRITDYGKNPENGTREKEIVARLEKRELKKACRVLLKEIAKKTGESLEKLLGAMEDFDPSDFEDMVDYEKFGGRENFEKAMDRCFDLDEELEEFQKSMDGEDDVEDTDCFCGCMDDEEDGEPEWVRAMDKCLDLDEACGFTGDEAEDEDENGGFDPGFMDFMLWDDTWDSCAASFLEDVTHRGAIEMAKRRVMDGRLAPEMIHGYADSLLGLIKKHDELIAEEMEKKGMVTADNFLDNTDSEKSPTVKDRLMVFIRKDRQSGWWYGKMPSKIEKADSDDYNRYVEIRDIEELVRRTRMLLRNMKMNAMDETKPFTAPFEVGNLRLNADGHTFSLKA